MVKSLPPWQPLNSCHLKLGVFFQLQNPHEGKSHLPKHSLLQLCSLRLTSRGRSFLILIGPESAEKSWGVTGFPNWKETFCKDTGFQAPVLPRPCDTSTTLSLFLALGLFLFIPSPIKWWITLNYLGVKKQLSNPWKSLPVKYEILLPSCVILFPGTRIVHAVCSILKINELSVPTPTSSSWFYCCCCLFVLLLFLSTEGLLHGTKTTTTKKLLTRNMLNYKCSHILRTSTVHNTCPS